MNLDLLRSFLLISELGSLSKAAERMRVSQSTLTRQMQALEHEIGGRLFERGHSGVALTNAGHRLLDGLSPLVRQLDALLAVVQQLARGKSTVVRIGYLLSLAGDLLNPALKRLRQSYPKLKVELSDLSPGEQLRALREGSIDIAMLGEIDRSVAREFYVNTCGIFRVDVALPEDSPLATKTVLRLKDLQGERFVSVPDDDIPGYSRWLLQLCRKHKFRPRFGDRASSLSHALMLVSSENLVTLVPQTSVRATPAGIVFRTLPVEDASWHLRIAWQRGKLMEPVRALVEMLSPCGPRNTASAGSGSKAKDTRLASGR